MKTVGKIIGLILLCVFITGVSYGITKYLDKNMYFNTDLLITFEDSKEFSLENTEKLTKKEALKTYPNTFIIENKSLKQVSYKVNIQTKNKELDKINYILYLNDKEVSDGVLSDLKDNVLYESTINKKKEDTYKLYLYLTEDDKKMEFTYSLDITSE